MQQPIEIEVDEHEQVLERVAGIDVAKASGMVCTRVPHETLAGKRVTKVWAVKTTTRGKHSAWCIGPGRDCGRVAHAVSGWGAV